MRKSLLIAAAAASLVATPAFAQDDAAPSPFAGPHVGVTIGTGGDGFLEFDGVTTGVEVGYDLDLGGGVLGLAVEYETDLGDDFFDANQSAVVARLGFHAGERGLLYGSAGYSRVSLGSGPFGSPGVDGFRLGAGAEFLIGSGGTSFKVEQRYANYGNDVDVFQTVAGLNFRF